MVLGLRNVLFIRLLSISQSDFVINSVSLCQLVSQTYSVSQSDFLVSQLDLVTVKFCHSISQSVRLIQSVRLCEPVLLFSNLLSSFFSLLTESIRELDFKD